MPFSFVWICLQSHELWIALWRVVMAGLITLEARFLQTWPVLSLGSGLVVYALTTLLTAWLAPPCLHHLFQWFFIVIDVVALCFYGYLWRQFELPTMNFFVLGCWVEP